MNQIWTQIVILTQPVFNYMEGKIISTLIGVKTNRLYQGNDHSWKRMGYFLSQESLNTTGWAGFSSNPVVHNLFQLIQEEKLPWPEPWPQILCVVMECCKGCALQCFCVSTKRWFSLQLPVCVQCDSAERERKEEREKQRHRECGKEADRESDSEKERERVR